MNLKHFKKIHEDEHSATLQHKHGHEMRIAKKPLSKDMRKQLDSLPCYSDGGLVDKIKNAFSPAPKETKTNMDADKAKSAQDSMRKAFGYADGGEVDEQEPMMSQMSPEQMSSIPDMDANMAPEAPQDIANMGGNPDPSAQQQAPDTMGMMQQPAEVGNQAMSDFAKSEAQRGQQEAKAAQQHEANTQKLMNDFQSHVQKIDQERAALQQDIKDGHIDPNHYVNSMTDMGKLSTAIGLILGGIGGGMLGTAENPAMKFLNAQIDRDIDAQKAEMGKKQNMMTALEHEYGNAKDAATAAHIFYSDMYKDKVMEAAARSRNPNAQLQAKMFAVKQEQSIMPMKLQLAQSQALRANLPNMAPEQAINYLPHQDQKMATEELGKLQQAQRSKKMVNSTLDEAYKINSVAGRASSPIQSREQLKAMEVNLLGILKPVFNNFSETDKEQALANMPSLTDNKETLANKKRNMQNLIDVNISTPTLNRYGIKLPQSHDDLFKPVK